MPSTLSRPLSVRNAQPVPPLVADFGLEEASPFGLQGLARETLRILKPEFINQLAVTLALRSTPDQIRDDAHVAAVLARHHDWYEEYSVVHLIERSLWISGRSDLVMTLTRNPSQIPDNPPRQITDILTQAYQLHPEATIWYGVPLFSDQTNVQGLPIPVTAAEVRDEARRRIVAARQHALRWGWVYRSAVKAAAVPSNCWRAVRRTCGRVRGMQRGFVEFFRRARKNARLKARAQFLSEQEYCRSGRERMMTFQGAQSMSLLDHVAMRSMEAGHLIDEVIPYVAPGGAVVPLIALKMMLIAPMTMVACDPFLFVELPDEPGKLRHLGHWYWQERPDGTRKLHLHT